MAMKVTMIFSVGRASPTETHYSKAFDDPTTPSAIAAALQLVGFRVALLGQGAALIGLRLSRSDRPRVVVNPPLVGVVVGNGLAGPGDAPNNTDQPNVSALLRCSDNFGNAKSLYLCGIPEGSIAIASQQPLYFQFIGPLAAGFVAYVNELQANWQFRVKAPLAPSDVVTAQNVTVPVPGVTITTNAPLAGQPTQPPYEVNLSGFRRSNTRQPGLSGLYRVLVVTPAPPLAGAQTFLLGETGNVQATNFLKLGTVAVNNFAFASYNLVKVVKSGTRKRGGSAAAPRGRSRPRA
jgi:hypothetical protein